VGKYSFSEYKIVWEAYGKKVFKPRIFDGIWQVNQSLQAFIPCNDVATANKILADLCDPRVEEYLLSSKMEGTMNWAQPGKISALLVFPDRQFSLINGVSKATINVARVKNSKEREV
jgi:thiamine pyrophosphate-dependent acetolactate synthase large subunit-like protein